jgi:hypothetical protein
MAAEAIPLINALLEAMGLTAAGSAKGKKYDIPSRYSKKEQKKDMEEHIKRMEAEEANKDDELPEDMKKDLAEYVNKDFAGFGGDPDNKDKKPKDDAAKAAATAGATKATESVVKNQPKKEKINYKDLTYEQRMALANKHLKEGPNNLDPDAAAKGFKQAQNRAWNKERGRTVNESEVKNAAEFRKPEPMHSKEAVDISREHFMEGKPNSLDTDKAVSELHGQQKSKFRNRTVTQDAKDILEHHRSPEDTRMTNKALPDEKLKKALGLGVGGIIGGIANALPLAGAEAYELDKDEMEDFLKSVNKYISSDDENDKAIGRAMMDSFLEDAGITIDDLIAKESGDKNTEPTWEQIKPEAERLINSDDPEDRKKGHELIEKYYLEDKEEPKKSKGKGLTGMDLY